MRPRPKSRYENPDGTINLFGVEPEYPEVKAWDKAFADASDQLAELEALKTGKPHWGRWFLTKAGLVTRTSRPDVGKRDSFRGGIYDISLARLDENWVSHMSEKNWIGEKGLSDLAIALKELKRRSGK